MDFSELLSFRKMITPTIIQILFWVLGGLAVLVGLFMLIGGLASRGAGAFVFMGLIYIVLGPIIIRVYCELVILLFKIHEEIVAIRKSLGAGGTEKTGGFPVMPVAPTPPPAK